MTKNEIAVRELLKVNKKATFKDVARFKIKWFIKVIYVIYTIYIELYDFENLF